MIMGAVVVVKGGRGRGIPPDFGKKGMESGGFGKRKRFGVRVDAKGGGCF